MSCFIKKIWQGETSEQVHRQFIRFSKGTFAGRAALNLKKADNIKLGGSFEFANDFVIFVSETVEARFSGKILSKVEIPEFGKAKPKNSVFEYLVENINSEKIKEISEQTYSMLLDAEGEGISLKMKKKLPKPGKSGDLKIDDKFCIIEADVKFLPQVRNFFMLPECKKAKISHTYIIEDIIIPEKAKEEKDFAKIRELAKRKGKIIRKEEIDKQERKEEKEFEA